MKRGQGVEIVYFLLGHLDYVPRVAELVEPEDLDAFVGCIQTTFVPVKALKLLLRATIRVEMERTTNVPLLLRTDSFLTKLSSSFARSTGEDYLKFVLGDWLQELQRSDETVDFEIQTSRLFERFGRANDSSTKEKVRALREANSTQLCKACQQVFDRLVQSQAVDDSRRSPPASLRTLAWYFTETAKSLNHTVEVQQALVNSFVMLRYLSPAILAPELFQLLSSDSKTVVPRVRRNLILVAKTLQALSNGATTLDREEPIRCIEEFLVRNRPAMQQFLNWFPSSSADDPLVMPTLSKQAVQIELSKVPKSEFDVLYQLLHEGFAYLVKDTPRKILAEDAQLVQLLQEIAPPLQDRKHKNGGSEKASIINALHAGRVLIARYGTDDSRRKFLKFSEVLLANFEKRRKKPGELGAMSEEEAAKIRLLIQRTQQEVENSIQESEAMNLIDFLQEGPVEDVEDSVQSEKWWRPILNAMAPTRRNRDSDKLPSQRDTPSVTATNQETEVVEQRPGRRRTLFSLISPSGSPPTSSRKKESGHKKRSSLLGNESPKVNELGSALDRSVSGDAYAGNEKEWVHSPGTMGVFPVVTRQSSTVELLASISEEDCLETSGPYSPLVRIDSAFMSDSESEVEQASTPTLSKGKEQTDSIPEANAKPKRDKKHKKHRKHRRKEHRTRDRREPGVDAGSRLLPSRGHIDSLTVPSDLLASLSLGIHHEDEALISDVTGIYFGVPESLEPLHSLSAAQYSSDGDADLGSSGSSGLNTPRSSLSPTISAPAISSESRDAIHDTLVDFLGTLNLNANGDPKSDAARGPGDAQDAIQDLIDGALSARGTPRNHRDNARLSQLFTTSPRLATAEAAVES